MEEIRSRNPVPRITTRWDLIDTPFLNAPDLVRTCSRDLELQLNEYLKRENKLRVDTR